MAPPAWHYVWSPRCPPAVPTSTLSRKQRQKWSLLSRASEPPCRCQHRESTWKSPSPGTCTETQPAGDHRYTLLPPVQMASLGCCGSQWKERTGRSCSSTAKSLSFRTSQIHTAFGTLSGQGRPTGTRSLLAACWALPYGHFHGRWPRSAWALCPHQGHGHPVTVGYTPTLPKGSSEWTPPNTGPRPPGERVGGCTARAHGC